MAKKITKTATKKKPKGKSAAKAKSAPKPKAKANGAAPAKQSGAAISNIEWYRAKLEEMRDDLMQVVQKKRDEVVPEAEVGDEGDVAMQSLARDLVFELTGNERNILEEVEAALRRIDKGTYGICEANGEKIVIGRLKAMPYARYCVNCQARFERS